MSESPGPRLPERALTSRRRALRTLVAAELPAAGAEVSAVTTRKAALETLE